MSTKKRTLITLSIYVIYSILLFCFVALTSKSVMTNPMYSIKIVYSLIFSVFLIGMGITTRIMSCKIWPLVLSCGMAMLTVGVSIYYYNWSYSEDAIYSATGGLGTKLSMFTHIGPDYFLYCFWMFIGAYLITIFAIAIIRKIKR